MRYVARSIDLNGWDQTVSVLNKEVSLLLVLQVHTNISQDSKIADGTTLIYADIGPNVVSRVQKVVAPDDSNYKV